MARNYINLFLAFFDDLQNLPKNAATRKLNDFIKRTRMAKVHAYIISSLKNDMPKFFGKGRKKKELIKTLPALLSRIQEQHLVSASDIPSVNSLQEKLQNCDFSKFPPLKDKLIITVNTMLDTDIADLVGIIPQGTSHVDLIMICTFLCRKSPMFISD